MSKLKPAPFYCPQCKAKYEIARMEAPSVAEDPEITCISCGTHFAAREGAFIVKYVLVERPE
jgi:predicted RNA-binding Zn-ribbon protein involved in translation (DUF1610 family)